MQLPVVVSAIVSASEGLACIGETVHEIGEEQIELQQYGVDRKNDSPISGTCCSEVEIDGYQTEGTEEDIPIDAEELYHGLVHEGAFQSPIGTQPSVESLYQDDSYQKSDVLGDDRT